MPMARNWAPRLLAGLLLAGGIATAHAQSTTSPTTGSTMSKSTTAPMTTSPMTTTPTTGSMTKSTAPMAAPNGAMVDINTASATELDTLPQIGKARAAKIIAGRPYKSTDDLVTKKVLTKGIYNKIKGRITAS